MDVFPAVAVLGPGQCGKSTAHVIMVEKSVIWSPLADEDLDRVLDYLEKNWGPLVSVEFLDELENVLSS
jgi:3-hydroxyacyl-CoA dehydrogenase